MLNCWCYLPLPENNQSDAVIRQDKRPKIFLTVLAKKRFIGRQRKATDS